MLNPQCCYYVFIVFKSEMKLPEIRNVVNVILSNTVVSNLGRISLFGNEFAEGVISIFQFSARPRFGISHKHCSIMIEQKGLYLFAIM